MSGILMMIIAIVVLGGAYLLYGRYLQNKWGIDPNAKTPAYEMEDGVDYVPADTNVVFGHQFASIAGAGPINGPIQAAIFGWLPVLLWILIGGVFFGAVQDFASMYASVKNKGRTIGYIIEEYIGKLGKKLFLLFCWLFCILVVAAFADVVAGTFNGFSVSEAGKVTKIAANGAVATTSMIFILEAVGLGMFLKYTKFNKWINTAVAIVLLVAAIALGLHFPMYVGLDAWHLIIFVYILIASVAPVWALLQPRDYLNSYLLIFMIVGAVGGLIASVGLFATGYISDSTTVQTVENMLDEDADTTDSRDDVTETDDKETTKEPVTANEDLGDSWKSYTVQINDKVLTFPCTKADVEAAGLSMDTEYTAENYMVNANEYELVYFMDANDNEIMAYAINNTDTAMEVKDCLIGGVSVDDYDLENGGLTVIFPGGLQMGASKDAVTGAYGEADDTYDGDSLSMYSWYSDDSYYKSCEIDFDAESGLVCTMTMQNFGQ